MNLSARVAIFGVAVAITAMLVFGVVQLPALLMPFLKIWTDWLATLDPVRRALIQAAYTGLPPLVIGLGVVFGTRRRRNAPAEPDPSADRWMPRKSM